MNHYQQLQLSSDASLSEIRKAFRREAKRYHPDHYQGLNPQEQQERQAQFIRLTQAYEVLSDPQKRAAYDRKLKTQQTSQSKTRKTSTSSKAKPRRPYTEQTRKPYQQTTQPPPMEDLDISEELGQLAKDLESLLGNFQLSLKNPVERLLEWALSVFAEVMQTLDAEESQTRQDTTQQKRHQKAEAKRASAEAEQASVQEELEHLKAKYRKPS